MSFGQRLREARKNAGLTQAQLAEILDISDSTVTSWEKETRQPDIPNIKRLTRALNVTPEYLLEIEKAPAKGIDEGFTEESMKREDMREDLRRFFVKYGFMTEGEALPEDVCETTLIIFDKLMHRGG